MIARVTVTPRKGVLDPQGKAVHHALLSLDFTGVRDVRVGRSIEIVLEGSLSREQAEKSVEEMCRRLLANPLIEDYSFEIHE